MSGTGAPKAYLGDGVYVEYDGFGRIKLYTHRENGEHVVYLDGEIIERLNSYHQTLKAWIKEKIKKIEE